MLKKFYCVCLCAWAAGAGGEMLTWNGTDGGAWDGTAQNWMDEAGRPCAWEDGADALRARFKIYKPKVAFRRQMVYHTGR